jgi:chromosome partition protein MukE
VAENRFPSLGDAVQDEHFPDVDMALRRGRHVDREDVGWYSLLIDAQEHLEPFYRRFGCELVHASEGYFYLLPTAERLGRRHLSVPEMLVGQTLALLYLDPATLQQGGAVTRSSMRLRFGFSARVSASLPSTEARCESACERVTAPPCCSVAGSR